MPTRESSSLERRGLRRARPAQETRRHLDEYVRRARLAGASWQVIGSALGITRQSAWERFRNLPGCGEGDGDKQAAAAACPALRDETGLSCRDPEARTAHAVGRGELAGYRQCAEYHPPVSLGTVPVYMHIPEKSRDSRRRTPSTTSAATYLFCLGDRGCQGR